MSQTPAIPPKLFEILEQQTTLAEQLLALLNEEVQVLTHIDLPALVNLNRQKEGLLKQLDGLDRALQEMATALGHDSSAPVRLKEIIARAEPETAARLEGTRGRLVALRRQIQDRTLINKKLASDILGYLNDAVALFVNPAAVQPGYGAMGPARPSRRQPTLISREI